ncbi:hypothetical protein [Aeromonas rivipollensis]|uniref:hypothetical protein n=1 Tax=Aeromonas rivipollensis TaxID=948519 RepID=UPI0038D235FF
MKNTLLFLACITMSGCASIISSVGDDFYPEKTKGKSEQDVVTIYTDDEIKNYDVALYNKNSTLIEEIKSESIFYIERTLVDEPIKIMSAITSAIPADKTEQQKDLKLRHPRVILPAGEFTLFVGCKYHSAGYSYNNYVYIPMKLTKGEKYIVSCYKNDRDLYPSGKITKLSNII